MHNTYARVCIDSREVVPGALFVALAGENTDGHRFVNAAFEKGAAAALVEQSKIAMLGLDEIAARHNAVLLPCQNTLDGLQKLAAEYLDKFPNLLRIGITGSSGKTTTKEIALSIFKQRKKVIANKGNLNSETGLPLSVFEVRAEHEVGIFEAGMNRHGEIAELARVLRPHIALITNVGSAHIGKIGSRKGIAIEKKALFSAFTGVETALIDADCDFAALLSKDINGKVVQWNSGEKTGDAQNAALWQRIKRILLISAKPMDMREYSPVEYTKLFPQGFVQTPLKEVKLGKDLFSKLGRKDSGARQALIGALYQTLKHPVVVIKEGDDYVFIKSFCKDNKSGYAAVIAVEKPEKNGRIVVTAYRRKEREIAKKIKKADSIVYVDDRGSRANESKSRCRSVSHNIEEKSSGICEAQNAAARSLGLQGWEIDVDGKPAKFPLTGRHNLKNAFAAIAIAQAAGIDGEAIRAGLECVTPLFGRAEIIEDGGVTIVRDCYNANPESAAAAIALCDELEWQGRRIYVLGSMLELGGESAAAHRELGGILAKSKADNIFLFGEETAAALPPLAGKQVFYTNGIDALKTELRKIADKNSLVLLKGSRGCALERAW